MSTNPQDRYLFGTGNDERIRLNQQGDFLWPVTEHFLLRAGLKPGMRVLEVGCGAGDVALLLADLVGSKGEVVGVDREPALLETASQRSRAVGAAHVRFVEADLNALGSDFGFDFAFGRFVLAHQTDPSSSIAAVARHVEPGGTIAFQEYEADALTLPPEPSYPLYKRVRGWITAALAASGFHVHMGFGLQQAFIAAGLVLPTLHAEALLYNANRYHPSDSHTIRMLLPVIVARGIATEEEIDIDTLEQRLAAERSAESLPYPAVLVCGAWARRS